jgi:hypothetical protein
MFEIFIDEIDIYMDKTAVIIKFILFIEKSGNYILLLYWAKARVPVCDEHPGLKPGVDEALFGGAGSQRPKAEARG